MKGKGILKVAFGLAAVVGCAIAAGVGTYKAYPKLKEAEEQDMDFKETVKYVAKDYAPAFGAVVLAGGVIATYEILGERRVGEMEKEFNKLMTKFNKVKGLYSSQTQAIKEVAPQEIQSEIFERERDMEALKYDFTHDIKVYDPITETVIPTTRGELEMVASKLNRTLMFAGVTYYEEFYSLLGLDIDERFRKLGWSWSTASAMWVDPWIDVALEESKDRRYDYILNFVCDHGDGKFYPFEPLENPESEDWH